MGERIKRIAKKTGKGFLCLIKLGFIVLCLLIWGALCVPLAESILPAFYDQCVYHEFAEKFLEKKYGEHINVHNERLPLSELNVANFTDYRYKFRLNGKTYQFLYYIRNFGDGEVFYGDNAQSDELYQFVGNVINEIKYSKRMLSNFDRFNWEFSEEVARPDDHSLAAKTKRVAMFTSKYTGDNLKEFPICLDLDYAYTMEITEKEMEEIFKDIRNKLLESNIICENISITCRDEFGYRTVFDIMETENGITIEREKY